jgi:shikimate kinase
VAERGSPRRLVLVGFMGAGKSTVGRLLARELGWGLLDMDRVIEQRTGLKVREIFAEKGEAFFREEERLVAEEARGLDRHVIAAGGGVFAFDATREALRDGSVSVWLWAPLEVLLQRVRLDGSRPLAANRETIARLFAEREPSYHLADCHVDATAGPDEVARRVRLTVFRADGARETEGR